MLLVDVLISSQALPPQHRQGGKRKRDATTRPAFVTCNYSIILHSCAFPLRDLTSEVTALPLDLLPGGIVEELPHVVVQEPRFRRE